MEFYEIEQLLNWHLSGLRGREASEIEALTQVACWLCCFALPCQCRRIRALCIWGARIAYRMGPGWGHPGLLICCFASEMRNFGFLGCGSRI